MEAGAEVKDLEPAVHAHGGPVVVPEVVVVEGWKRPGVQTMTATGSVLLALVLRSLSTMSSWAKRLRFLCQ